MLLHEALQHKIAGEDYEALLTLQQISLEGELSEEFLDSYQELSTEYATEGLDRIYRTAVEQYELSQFTVSRDYLLKVLEIRPEFPEALYWLGVSYWNLHDQSTATQYLTELVEKYPDHGLATEARRLLGRSA
jgi:TolA-binding protein